METLTDVTLAEVLEGRRNGDVRYMRAFTLYRLLEVLQRVAEHVANCHERKKPCLNLTPEHIRVGTFGRIEIGAGNGARKSSRRTRNAARDDAELAYLAPEQLPGARRKPGPASDVYALGAILYEILCDRPPALSEAARRARESDAVPEPSAIRGGIDPAVAALCVNCLHPDPARRPAAAAFFEHIARYVRRELDWEVIRFGRGARGLDAAEWTTLRGKWRIDGHEWVAGEDSENVLVWNTPVAGSFRFICEGWVESEGELSLIGHGPGPEMQYGRVTSAQLYQGYCFQFGAEHNTCTKLARDGDDVLVIPRMSLRARKRYRIEIEYADGWFRGFIDGKQLLAYQELFPGTGCQVGFYAYARGTHFQPLEIHRQNWALEVPAMQVADEFYKQGYFEAAMERYKQLALRFGGRFEGAEARLKVGACLAKMKRFEEAQQAFGALSGSILEPYALAEEGMLHFRSGPAGDPRVGLERFRTLLARFPGSQAVAAVLKVREPQRPGSLKAGLPLDQDCELRLDLYRMMSRVYDPGVLIQARSHDTVCALLLQMGRYEETLRELLAFKDKLLPMHTTLDWRRSNVIAAALANGRDDLLPPDLRWERADAPYVIPWTGLTLHRLIRSEDPQKALREILEKPSRLKNYDPESSLQDQVLFHLALNRPKDAAKFLEKSVIPKVRPTDFRTTYLIGGALVDARHSQPFQSWIAFLSKHVEILPHSNVARVIALLNARWALEGGRLEEAARCLQGMTPPPHGFTFNDGLLLQIMLSSLGILTSPIQEELQACYELYLTGTELDLARMFFGMKEARPGKLWPHPLWRPEWRLWLALWQEARRNKPAARELAHSAIDARYGLTHSQPALQALLERC